MVRGSFKNKYKQDMCSEEIGLCDKNSITILDPTINIWENMYDHLISIRIFTLDDE